MPAARTSLLVVIALWTAIISVPCRAGSFEVAPVTINLPADGKAGVFYITNRGESPIVAQVEGFEWQQADNNDQLIATDALMFSPPMVRLEPGQQQTVRLMVRPDIGAPEERTFRLIVSELPDPQSKSTQSVQMLLQFSIPVFIGGSHDDAVKFSWSIKQTADGIFLNARNDNLRCLKLSDLHLTTPEGQSSDNIARPFTYILPGATHQWKIDSLAPSPTSTYLIKAHEDRSDKEIGASVVVEK